MIKRKNGKFVNCFYPVLDEYPLLTAISSTLESPFGDINDGISDIELENHLESTEKSWLKELNISPENIVSIKQVHEGNVFCADEGGFAGEYDGALTSKDDLFLRVVTADCIPLFLFDPVNNVTGLIHAGWRSLNKKIITEAVKTSCSNYGSKPENMIAAIGPHINDCCYEVGKEVADLFLPQYSVGKDNGKYMLNIGEAAREELINNGLLPENIEYSTDCTFCHPDTYFSARRGRYGKGRLIHLIGSRSIRKGN
ncbi:MAG: peptidoglycan editing factor PgeF [bacterium]|nr:peptidoglycan editing factor PgeF [bacterium]